MMQHALPFFFAMFLDHGFFLFFGLQVHAHTNGVSLGMKLRTDHIIIKANSHNSPFIGHMWPVLFNTKNLGAHFLKYVMVRLYHLVIAAVNAIEWIFQTRKYRLIISTLKHMNREHAKGSRAALTNDTNIIMTTGQLERMTNEQHIFLLFIGWVIVPAFHFIKPAEIIFFPFGITGFKRRTGPAT